MYIPKIFSHETFYETVLNFNVLDHFVREASF